MQAEIITIGDEILIGQIVDTNATFIAKQLTKIGVKVSQITSIQDNYNQILETLSNAQNKVSLVIITGGLGPTKDDITKQAFCDYFNDTLIKNETVYTHVKQLYKKYTKGKLLPESMHQALVPSKATILFNKIGTAPGLWMQKEKTVFVSLPGVPYEMKQLLVEEVIPRVTQKFDRPFIYQKTLLTFGSGESEIAKRIYYWENNLPKEIKLAYLPAPGRVRLRLMATGKDEEAIKKKVDSQMQQLKVLLEDVAVGFEEDGAIEEIIAQKLVSKKQTLSIIESCTGGAIATQFTQHPGASTFFKGSMVPYDTAYKIKILGIEKDLIEKHTVVSDAVAIAMAKQGQKLFESDFCIATTGAAGPSVGETQAEVGTVCIAIATPENIYSKTYNFGQPRERVIQKGVNKALEMLLKELN
jgi:nicotinamide-nucleotide amidase